MVCFLPLERSTSDFAVCVTTVDLAEHERGWGGFRRRGARRGAGAEHTGITEAVNGNRRHRQVAPVAVAREHGGGAATGHGGGHWLQTQLHVHYNSRLRGRHYIRRRRHRHD